MSDDRMARILEGLGESSETNPARRAEITKATEDRELEQVELAAAFDDQQAVLQTVIDRINGVISDTGYELRLHTQERTIFVNLRLTTVVDSLTWNLRVDFSSMPINSIISSPKIQGIGKYSLEDLGESFWDNQVKTLLEAEAAAG